jgi:23S rRNA (cytidine2498-2'-O)-methyltransferase
LRLAYSRPGLITWKSDSEVRTDFQLASPLARVSGVSLGKAAGVDEVVRLARALKLDSPPALAVFGLDVDPEESPDAATSTRARVLETSAQLAAVDAAPWTLAPPSVGQRVLDVMVTPNADEPHWLGLHTQRGDQPNTPGLAERAELHPAAPSRAYCKLQEMLALSEVALPAGAHAVEIGAAPGGAVYALLERGLHVTAVDPAPLATSLGAFAGERLRHVALPAGRVQRRDLPPQVFAWLLDANLAPPVALHYLERLTERLSSPPGLVLITLKMNDRKMQDQLDALLARCRTLGERLGLTELRAAQLPSHRAELGVVLRRP